MPNGGRSGAMARQRIQAGQQKSRMMRISDALIRPLTALAFCGCFAAPAAHAFDSNQARANNSSPWAVFRFGFDAYKKGDKDEAAEAYRYAAEKGHRGALWKLGRMYAEGDGVARDDYQAYRFFEQVVTSGAENPGPDESYISDALVNLAAYLKTGIDGTPVKRNPQAAHDLYMRAATLYGDSRAQFEIGRMYLEAGGERSANQVKQAARWLRLAAGKGHAGAQAMLGDLLFQSGNTVRGLAMMTAALQRATPSDRTWIARLQENAFGLAGEADRRTAIVLAEDIIKNGQ